MEISYFNIPRFILLGHILLHHLNRKQSHRLLHPLNTLWGHPLSHKQNTVLYGTRSCGDIFRYINEPPDKVHALLHQQYVNGMSLIWNSPIQWGHRLLHKGLAATGSSLITLRTEVGIISRHINMGTSFITSKYFCFNRHLSSGRCRYCFLETRPIIRIHYIR